ncbi:hypothetical protein MMC30_005457 [Trapelia coarctata]|nr:hypothetical protein [Trapelia coarctata]
MSTEPISPPPKDLAGLSALENSLLFRAFTADTAFDLGTHLRNRLRALAPSPCVISIALSNAHLLFHACSHPGTAPDSEIWVARKRKTVLRWGVSSYYMGRKFGGDERKFAEKYMLGEGAGQYAIHGGAVPVRVEGMEGVVAVVVVSGLRQEEDHMVVVEGMEDCIREMGERGE